MASRKALIIGYPGEKGANNYCEGVNLDIENYKSFLTSPLGGSWSEDEVKILYKPTKEAVSQALQSLKYVNYSKIIFSGHGAYSPIHDSTFLKLNKNEAIDSAELRGACRKQTIILDCCRKVKRAITEEKIMLKEAEAAMALNPEKCRILYDKRIEECDTGFIVMNACSINEKAYDDSSRGGYYSYYLIKSAIDWADRNIGSFFMSPHFFSVVSAHNTTSTKVLNLSGGQQNPQIEKPRSDPYFPFAILA
jgi:hypothetical protein